MEGLHSHDPGHEISNIATKQINKKTALHPVILVFVHTLYEIAINQHAIDADKT